jgi:hypothetical protein
LLRNKFKKQLPDAISDFTPVPLSGAALGAEINF